jgi:hypothetical protein
LDWKSDSLELSHHLRSIPKLQHYLLRATEVELQKIVLANNRKKRRLRGKAKIALRVGRLIERFKMAKHFVLEIKEDAFGWKRNETKIAEEAALDGVYVVRTSVDHMP